MKVAIVKCESYEQKNVDKAVKEALSLIGFKFKNRAKVLLKPNLIGPFKPEEAATTHPAILIALCKILKRKGAKVYIGDSPGHPAIQEVLEACGIKSVAEKFNAQIINFNSSKLIKLENKNNNVLRTVELPDIIKKVDIIINLPKLKTHILTRYTGAVKNLYGFIIGGKKSYYHKMSKDEKNFSEILVDLHSFIKPQLTVMDAVIGMEGSGPTSGSPKKTGLILASKDCTALDIVASGIIGYKPEDISTIAEAKERGFNNRIEQVGSSNMRIFYKKPFRLHQTILPKFLTDMVYKQRIFINKQECKRCLVCYRQCPAKAIALENGIPKINEKTCIRCYCCHELCPSHAVEVRTPIIVTYGRKLLRLIT